MLPFGRNRYGQKIGGAVPLGGRGAGSPSNTMWPGPRPTRMPSFILIRPTVWPQWTNVTDRQDKQDRTDRQTDRQGSDSIGRTVLQAVAPEIRRFLCFVPRRVDRRKCYQLSSTVISLSHWASTFVYKMSTVNNVARFVLIFVLLSFLLFYTTVPF